MIQENKNISQKNDITNTQPISELEILKIKIEMLSSDIIQLENDKRELQQENEALKLEAQTNLTIDENAIFEIAAKAVEHFTYTDHTSRNASQVIRSL
jgi:hypothetical protein